MFNPNQEDVRRFFCAAFAKAQKREVLSPLESLAIDWINQHPEYHPHLAAHEIMECLGEMIWESQRSGQPPDGAAYIEAVKRRAQ